MKLAVLLGSIALAWCLLGALVLGVAVLVYPLVWGGVAMVLLGVHKLNELRGGRGNELPRRTAPRPAEMSRDETAALVR